MRFTVAVRYWTRRQEVTWEDGELSADDPDFLDVVLVEAAAQEGFPVGQEPTGPFTFSDHLADPLSALWLIRGMVPAEDFLGVEGDLPEPPEVPDGAIV